MSQRLQTYAITSIAYQRRRVFQRTAIADLFIANLFRYREGGRFLLHGFVVMPDHFHVLLTPAAGQTVEGCAQLIKGGFSFAVRKEYVGEIWQAGYHAHRVTDEDDLRNQLTYIENNPVRKHYLEYPHIHTAEQYLGRLDALPQF